jgi:LEA14-like dessication related protein
VIPRARIGLGVWALVLAGCAGIGDLFKEPEVRLDRVTLRGVGVSGGMLDLVVDVHNPNGFDLRGTGLRLGFEVEGSHVGDVAYDSDFVVDQGDTTRLTLPVTFSWAGVGSAVRSALGYGEIPYTMKGELSLDTPLGRRSVPFERQGRAPLFRSGSAPIPGTH